MTSTPPPDHYAALGLTQSADAAEIKKAYRKLVIQTHPDKFVSAEESVQKLKKAEFQKLQAAYEILGDEDKRQKYDAEVRLEKQRKDAAARGGSKVEVKTARFETRTAAPAGAGATFTSTGPARFEERKPSSRSSHDDRDRYYETHYETYESFPRQSPSRTSRAKEEPSRSSKSSSDRTRSERVKTRDREERRDRAEKFVYLDDSSSQDEKQRYERGFRSRDDGGRRRHSDEEIRRAAESRHQADLESSRHSYDDELRQKAHAAIRHIHRTEAEARPSASRSSSSRDARPTYERTSSSRRPDTVRRSSARPRDRERKGIEIVDWEDDHDRRPSFKHSASSPAEIHIPSRVTPTRSQTEYIDHRRVETSPTPQFRRSETMPVPSSSSRRKEAPISRPSGLRSSESASSHPHIPEPIYANIPPPATTTTYYYATPSGVSSLRSDEPTHRTILREPLDSHRARSPPPLSKPPMGSNRPVETTRMHSSSTIPPPPLGRNASSGLQRSPTRDAPRLYREMPSEYTTREKERSSGRIRPENVSYTRKIGPEDVMWAPRRGREERGREYDYDYDGRGRPYLGRSMTVSG